MQVHFLGTNGWYCTDQGDTPCVLIDAAEAYVILDAGNGLYKIDQHIRDPHKPIYLFLSHFHLDHTYGLHITPKFRFAQGITLIGQPGTAAIMAQFWNSPFTAPRERVTTRITIQEVAEGTHAAPLPFTCKFLVHADPCFGYRLTLEGKTITYCTDTGACPQATELAQDADLLIAECTWMHEQQFPGWPHLAPEDGARMARQAQAKQLALMHFEASQYTTRESRLAAQAKARGVFPATRAMFDGDTLTV